MPAGDGHPLSDETGEDCGVGQDGPVWFLGGGFAGDDIDVDGDGEADGTRVELTRACTVPAGKAILQPIVNTIWSNIGEEPLKTDEELLANARLWADAATGLSAEIDGVAVESLEDYRFATDVFDFDYVADSPISTGLPDGSSNAAADGHWLLLNPLSPGEHTIHLVGSYVFTAGAQGFDWIFEEDVTYTLTVN